MQKKKKNIDNFTTNVEKESDNCIIQLLRTWFKLKVWTYLRLYN